MLPYSNHVSTYVIALCEARPPILISSSSWQTFLRGLWAFMVLVGPTGPPPPPSPDPPEGEEVGKQGVPPLLPSYATTCIKMRRGPFIPGTQLPFFRSLPELGMWVMLFSLSLFTLILVGIRTLYLLLLDAMYKRERGIFLLHSAIVTGSDSGVSSRLSAASEKMRRVTVVTDSQSPAIGTLSALPLSLCSLPLPLLSLLLAELGNERPRHGRRT